MNQNHLTNKAKFHGKCLLSIDYGTKVVGLASTKIGIDPFPTPFGRLIYQNDQQTCNELFIIIQNEAVDVVILGLPRHEDGNDSDMTMRVRKFSELLQEQHNGTEFFFQDETYSSYEAKSRMKSSAQYNFKVDPKQIDAVAACVILEDFLKL
ncbi:MAG: Holliday junction resolvase RuvX [Bacteriovoracaceae bacterium]|jgi:putative holliday junction resolvase|nr:Holliday junction resolvase RuvX [Bacteriovoracaceae bacterium]